VRPVPTWYLVLFAVRGLALRKLLSIAVVCCMLAVYSCLLAVVYLYVACCVCCLFAVQWAAVYWLLSAACWLLTAVYWLLSICLLSIVSVVYLQCSPCTGPSGAHACSSPCRSPCTSSKFDNANFPVPCRSPCTWQNLIKRK
jgi:hypothetical protein